MALAAAEAAPGAEHRQGRARALPAENLGGEDLALAAEWALWAGLVEASVWPPTNVVPGFPLALVANQSGVASFTIPGTLPSGAVFGSGAYIIEVDAAGEATGSYTVQIATP